jgi:hypothetical protein
MAAQGWKWSENRDHAVPLRGSTSTILFGCDLDENNTIANTTTIVVKTRQLAFYGPQCWERAPIGGGVLYLPQTTPL